MSIEYTNYFGDDDVETTTIEDGPFVEEKPSIEEDSITLMGTVYNAPKVYMRERPDKDANHVSILDKGEEVMIDGTEEDAFGNGWYHLVTASGKEGYMMSEFVKIEE